MDRVSVILLPEGEAPAGEELISSLEENCESIEELVTAVPVTGELPFPVKYVPPERKKLGELRNELVKAASSDYVLFISPGSQMEDGFIEELIYEQEESGADLVFPNLIRVYGGQEQVKNFQDPFEREGILVSSLAVEDFLPQWGVLLSKGKIEELGGFDPTLDDYDFYHFVYKGLKGGISIKLAELSYLRQKVVETFVDTSYRSFVLRSFVLKNFDWKRELFPFLSWDENPKAAQATALTLIAERLSAYLDLFNASEFLRQALVEFHNGETFRRLIEVYRLMGLFEEARRLLKTPQGVDEELVKRELEMTEKIESLVNELEKGVEEGKVQEVLKAAVDTASVYDGAPIYNLLGVINWLAKRPAEAYRFFYKAVTMNPINQDYLYNLSGAAKELGKEDEVFGLLERLLGDKVAFGR
ncbi:glycosyltransferase [Thermovibrio ammonificans]|jgi:tetratricopeptide (TPR) repeat protein